MLRLEFVPVPTLPDLSSMEQWTILIMAGVTCLWFFGLGTAFGSFLNVVVYRMPRGLPVGGARSHCPGCMRLIPWYDNIPIFGYLRLRGRCQCRDNLISPRYPLVETTVGLIAITLLMIELLSGGANLPIRQPNDSTGVFWFIGFLHWDLVGTYVYHVTLLYVLLGLMLIDLDGFGPPPRWVGFGLTVGLLSTLIAPFLQLVPITGVSLGTTIERFETINAIARAVVGLIVGTILGLVLASPWRDQQRPHGSKHLITALALVGTYLGWQSALSIALGSSLLLMILRRAASDEPELASVPPSIIVWLVTLIHILTWRFLASVPIWPGPSSEIPALVSAVVLFVGLALLTGRIPKPALPLPTLTASLPGHQPVVLVEIGPMEVKKVSGTDIACVSVPDTFFSGRDGSANPPQE